MRPKTLPVVTLCSVLILLFFAGSSDRALAGGSKSINGKDWKDCNATRPEPVIVMWSGPLADIPADWLLCDGSTLLPDLRDRFIQGVIDFQEIGGIGGAHQFQLDLTNLPEHAHPFYTSEDGEHFHEGPDKYGDGSTYEISGWTSFTGTEPYWTLMGLYSYLDAAHSHSGTTDLTGNGLPFDNRPAYYRLAFIARPRAVKGSTRKITVAPGSIVIWSDSAPPAGWEICNGTNGTPDLRDRFVLGVQEGQDPGETGGSNSVVLSEDNLPSHGHPFQTGQSWLHNHYYEDLMLATQPMTYGGLVNYGNIAVSDIDSDTKITDMAGDHNHSGTVDQAGNSISVENRPSYRRMPFIMLTSTGRGQTVPVPVGAIVFWYGKHTDLPDGWQLCDGTNGAPDLRDRFVLGGESAGEEGGQNQVQLSLDQMPAHRHTFTTSTNGEHDHEYVDQWRKTVWAWATGWSWTTYCGSPDYLERSSVFAPDGKHYHTGTTYSIGSSMPYDNRPAYYKAAYIMRMN